MLEGILIRVDTQIFKYVTKNLRIQIYPDTCGRGPRPYIDGDDLY